MDQRSDTGDQQHERQRQLVDLQPHVGGEVADEDPVPQVLDDPAVLEGRASIASHIMMARMNEPIGSAVAR